MLEASKDIQTRTAEESKSIGFMPTLFVNACLPHSKCEEEKFIRINGKEKTTFIDVHNVGLPYGSLSRILLVWIATHAIQKQERRIELEGSMSRFMKSMNMQSSGGNNGSIKRIKRQIVSLLSCAVTHVNIADNSLILETTPLTNRQHYWWSNESTSFDGAYIELSQEFYDRVIQNSAPVDIRAINLLRRSPLAIDIYIWLTYKMGTIPRATTISYKRLISQIGAGYSNDKKGLNRFQQAFKKQLSYVLTVYPSANIEVLPGRVQLKPGKPHVNKIQNKS